LRIEREHARLTQAGLAHRAGMRQQHVSRFETGRFASTTTVVERLFAALGWQLRMELEPVDAEFDAEIARAAAQTDEHVEMTVEGRQGAAPDQGIARVTGWPRRWAAAAMATASVMAAPPGSLLKKAYVGRSSG
jgi:transcriptional regulator with XRE-family HTH domain